MKENKENTLMLSLLRAGKQQIMFKVRGLNILHKGIVIKGTIKIKTQNFYNNRRIT